MRPLTFTFDDYAFDAKTGELRLRYSFDTGPAFEETITFTPPYAAYDAQALDRIFRLLFLLAGVSYYKAFVPEKLSCKPFTPDTKTANWIERVYEDGLGEFAFRNKLSLKNRIRFENMLDEAPQPLRLDLPERDLVPVGGGKDSIVTLEALKAAGHNVTAFVLGGPKGPATPIADTIRISGLPHVFVSRILDPALIDLNKTPGIYNGHVPITAILSAIALACAVLYGFRAVVMSNEHSASAPNLTHDGAEVNHQYSKSFAFERDLAGWVKSNVSPDLAYFSLLRPLGEIDIARRFAKAAPYHDVFRSCNTAFRQDEKTRGKKWCCDCPKCRFVFLALAPFMEKTRLVEIFGANMLDDPVQTQGFVALCGIESEKPFECVGEVEESAAALHKLAAMPDWKDDAVVKTLSDKITTGDFETLFTRHTDHAVPPAYMKALDE